jgi:uncharacterized membrane protein
MIGHAFALVALLATSALAAPMTAWDAKQNGDHKAYNLQGLSLKLASGKNEDGQTIPVLTIMASGVAPYDVDGEVGFENAEASFGVGRFDPKAPAPQVLFATYTGGAHCCVSISLIERAGNGWKEVPLGEWDGDVPDKLPADIDGDGAVDFVFIDNNFLYGFDSYAASWAPPQILNLIAGSVIDVSGAPRYRKLYEADMARTKPECAKHANGACAAFAADAARLGRFGEAWKFVLANYDKDAVWDWPTHCAGIMQHGKCAGTVVKPGTYPQALRWFLEDNRYIARRPGN